MQSGAHRAVAIAPMAGEMKGIGANQGVFPFGLPVPQFFQPSLGFHPSNSASTSRTAPNNSRSGVCASRHMAAEQRRRARINERLEALRTIVPHSARANTAAFLTEVYDYISSLHKQLERLGGETFNLDTVAVDKVKESAITVSDNKVAKVNDVKSDGESDVDSAIQVSNQEDPTKAFVAVAPAPPFFCSSSDKSGHIHSPARSPLRLDCGNGESLKSAFTPTTSTVCSPEFTSSQNYNPLVKSTADNSSSQVFRSVLPVGPSNLSVPENLSQQQFNLPLISSLHPSAFAAVAAAAVADATAAAQSWGMAAAVAHAQAQVAAQMHVQAQAMAQVQAMNARSAPPPVKKRRRGTVRETCASRQRTHQGVVRPIALKPQ